MSQGKEDEDDEAEEEDCRVISVDDFLEPNEKPVEKEIFFLVSQIQ